ncbi:MAG: alpha/beta fold hydrolase [Nocardioides sp.]
MDRTPRLIETLTPQQPEGVVLVLHGGANREGNPMVSPTQLSVIRMIPVARRLARAGRGRLAVFRLLNSHRGWDTHTTPVDDVAWALRQLVERYAGVPVGLVGHSLGGRAALLAGGRHGVRSVVALNPWVYPTDTADLSGRRVLIVHGTADRIAQASRSEAVARRLGAFTEVGYISIEGGKHAMLSHGADFEKAAAAFTTAALLGLDSAATESPAVARILAGERWVSA